MEDHIDTDEINRQLIAQDFLELFTWFTEVTDFNFDISLFNLALERNSGQCLLFLYENYSSQVQKQAIKTIESLVDSLGNSNQFMEYKLFFFKMFFPSMKAAHLISFLNPMKRKIIDITDVQENPFIFTLNPIKSGLLIIELMRIIRQKFKSLQVKCLEIEIYMKTALTTYAELLQDESEI